MTLNDIEEDILASTAIESVVALAARQSVLAIQPIKL